MNRENLERAISLLETVKEENFTMYTFKADRKTSNLEEIKNICGTAACVVGHCVLLDKDENLDKYFLETWRSAFFFDYASWSSDFFGTSELEWDWLFSSKWLGVDNTVSGAIKRIKYLLKEGLSVHISSLLEIGDYKSLYDLYKNLEI